MALLYLGLAVVLRCAALVRQVLPQGAVVPLQCAAVVRQVLPRLRQGVHRKGAMDVSGGDTLAHQGGKAMDQGTCLRHVVLLYLGLAVVLRCAAVVRQVLPQVLRRGAVVRHMLPQGGA